ncbi:MAG: U32 family peptidase [Muribaculaceae bacterium]|nr:U32 family peptidase [Muribaculaceae bacterium]
MSHDTLRPRKLELLAPARDTAIGIEAVTHGADAVYIGADAFGARAAARNDVSDIASLVDFAHRFDSRVYVTLNTLIYDNELREAEALIRKLYSVGVDALIVQDLSVLRMDIPPIALHASTQCDTRTPAKARFLEDCGFSQIVLSRELSLEQIRDIASSVSVPIEAFVHGALCVSYSGDCQASLFSTGRSANRGECAQMCRLPYSLTDASGRKVAPDGHYLSLRDMNRLDRLAELADAGVSSFKIEGRLKESGYVRNTVAAYSRALDDVVAASDGGYQRMSVGKVNLKFEPDVTRSFNRRFTSYFLDGRPAGGKVNMASIDSPKWIGRKVGSVKAIKGKSIVVKSTEQLNNGDGLGFFDASGCYNGFRVNRVDGNTIFPASEVSVRPGDILYRNRDKKRDDLMSGSTAVRTIEIDSMLRRVDNCYIALKLSDSKGYMAECIAECEVVSSRTPQLQPRERVIRKTGDTIYRVATLTDLIPDDSFVAASVLADLRRKTIAALDDVRRSTYLFDYRRQEKINIDSFRDGPLDRHDNIANHLSRQFFADHGIAVRESAAEVEMPDKSMDQRVMKTRYCLRRELGACLKTPQRDRLPSPLFLRATGVDYRLDFDCKDCSMSVIMPAKQPK